ncbi:unnamed protein product, partial [marine sediment metagenome]
KEKDSKRVNKKENRREKLSLEAIKLATHRIRECEKQIIELKAHC